MVSIPLMSLLLVIVASGLGALLWWIGGKLAFHPAVCMWIGLFVFGAILIFGKIT